MRVIAIADNDSLVGHLEASSIDVLISLGDLWDKTIEIAMDRYEPNALFAVRGNHDLDAPFPPFVTPLHLTIGNCLDMTFGGFNGNWRCDHFLEWTYSLPIIPRRASTSAMTTFTKDLRGFSITSNGPNPISLFMATST